MLTWPRNAIFWSPRIQRVAVLTVTLVGLAAVGVATHLLGVYVGILAGGVVVGLVLAGRPELSAIAVTVAALTVRFSLPAGTGSRIVASLLVGAAAVVVWLGRMLIVDRRLVLARTRTRLPALLFIAFTLMSYVWANAFRDPLVMLWESWPYVQLGALAVMVLLPGMFLIAANTLTTARWVRGITLVILGAGVLTVFRDVWGLPLTFLQTRPLFPTWFMCLAYAEGLFNTRASRLVRAMWLMLVGLSMYNLLAAQVSWLSSWLPSALGLLTISWIRSKKLALVLLAVCIVLALVNFQALTETYVAEKSVSGNTRLAAYRQNLLLTREHWLFGTGPAGYAAYYMTYFPGQAMATHSNYLDVLSQAGIAGLAAFLGILVGMALTVRELVMHTAHRCDHMRSFAVASAGGLVGVIVACGLGDWVLPFVYTQTIAGFDNAVYTWILMGTAVALHRIVTADQSGAS